MLGANFVDKQYPIHDFCSSLSASRALIPLRPDFSYIALLICQVLAVDYNWYSTIPNVSSDIASDPCLFCREAVFGLYSFACVNNDLNGPARFGEKESLLLRQLLLDCYLAGTDARSELLPLQRHWTGHLPCGVGTLEAQSERGRKKPIHPIILSMTQ